MPCPNLYHGIGRPLILATHLVDVPRRSPGTAGISQRPSVVWILFRILGEGQPIQFVVTEGIAMFSTRWSYLQYVRLVEMKQRIVPQAVKRLFQKQMNRVWHPLDGRQFHFKGSRDRVERRQRRRRHGCRTRSRRQRTCRVEYQSELHAVWSSTESICKGRTIRRIL